jgi:hypothetical protein
MSKNLISRICIAVALILTVYNFIIVEEPVDQHVTGIILLLLIASNAVTSVKFSK